MANDKLRVYYHDPWSILVINPKGHIRKLYAPFMVLCIEPTAPWLKKGAWVFVDEVKTTSEDELIFIIGGLQFPHRHFRIQINF
jgi:hypothetical protein